MKVTGSNITITDSVVNKMQILPLGNAEQDTYIGKNKFNQANVTQLIKNSASTTSGISNQNDIITITNSYGALGTYSMLSIMNITSGQVTISFKAMLSGTNAGNGIFINVFDTNHVNACSNYQQLTAQSKDTWYDYTATFTLNEYAQNGINLDIQAWNGGNSIKLQNIQVEVGSTVTTYEPYVGGIPSPNPSYPQDVKVVTGDNQVVISNANLLDLSNITEGYLIGRFDGELAQNVSYGASDFIPVKANQSYCQNSTNTWYGAFYDVNKTYVEEVQNQVIITPSVDGYVRVSFLLTNKDSVSVNKGTTPITYIQGKSQSYTLHLGSLELCKIGDYQDVITGTKDNWKVVRNIRKVVLDGSESDWEGSTNRYALNIDMADGYYFSLCNYFRDVGGWSVHTLTNNTIAVFKNAGWNKGRISFNTDVVPSGLANFKTWLSTHNTIVYYQLAEPIEETITDTSLIEELNELQELLSYDGTTNITATSEDTNAQMEVEVTYTSESDMNEKLTNIFNLIKSKLYHIIRSL